MSNDVTYKEYQVIVREKNYCKYKSKEIFWFKPNSHNHEEVKLGNIKPEFLHREDDFAYIFYKNDKEQNCKHYLNGKFIYPEEFKKQLEKLNNKSSYIDEIISIGDKKYKLVPVE